MYIHGKKCLQNYNDERRSFQSSLKMIFDDLRFLQNVANLKDLADISVPSQDLIRWMNLNQIRTSNWYDFQVSAVIEMLEDLWELWHLSG